MDDTVTEPLTTLVWQPPGGAAALRPDGVEAVTGGYDGRLTVWNVATGRPVRSWQAHHGWVWVCVYHPGLNVLVSTGADGMARVWDGLTGALLAEFQPGGRPFHSIAFAPDGELLATFGWTGQIVLWRSTTEPVAVLSGHSGWVASVAFHPDGTQLVSTGGADGTVRAWDTTTGSLRHLVHRADHGVTACGFRPGADQFITAGSSDIRLWDAATWDLVHHQEEVRAEEVAVSPDGRRVAAGALDGVRLWDVPSGEVVTGQLGDHSAPQWLGFSPDGREVMVRQVERLAWLDAASGEQLRSATGSIGAQVTTGACDGAVLVTGGQDGRIRIWDVDRGTIRHTVDAHTDAVLDVAVQGDLVVSVGAEGVVCVIDAAAGHVERAWTANGLIPRRCYLRPGGDEVLLAGGRAGVAIWRVADGVPLGRVLPEVYQVFDAVVTAAGRELLLAQSVEGLVGVWDPVTGQSVGRCGADDLYPSCAALSPDGGVAVTGDHDGRLTWWDVTDGRLLRVSDGDLAPISVCVFADDGREVLTGHVDGRVQAWDAATGQAGRRFDGQYGQVNFCWWSPRTGTLLAGGTDRSTRMWDTQTTAPVGFRFEALPDGDAVTWAVPDGALPDGDAVTWAVPDGALVDASPGAGRWLGRSVVDADAGITRWVPYRA